MKSQNPGSDRDIICSNVIETPLQRLSIDKNSKDTDPSLLSNYFLKVCFVTLKSKSGYVSNINAYMVSPDF